MTEYLTYEIAKVSQLTQKEYVAVKSTLHAIEHREFICGDCLAKYRGRSDEEAMLKKMRSLKGCFGVGDRMLHHIDREIQFSQCIGNYFDFSVLPLLEMYKQYERGNLPYPGSMSEQPAKIIEVFGLIEKNRDDRAEALRKSEAASASRGSGRLGGAHRGG